MLIAAAAQIAYRREIILVSGDASASASPMALNVVQQFRSLKLHHVLYLSDGHSSCERLRTVDPQLACVWSSFINTSRPRHAGVCVARYWDMRFYFYDIRKHLVARLAADLGYNVLQTDTDVVWFANPYPILKIFGTSIISQVGTNLMRFDLSTDAFVYYVYASRRVCSPCAPC